MRADYPSASVVIPTHNRRGDLQRVLEALERQRAPDGAQAQIVVVDDGSSDGTWQWLTANRRPEWSILRQDNAGPARARNRGVSAATAEIVLFLGDDTIPQEGWLAEHLEEHRLLGRGGPLAVVGYTSFPVVSDSPFLRWINEFGAQFGYLLITSPTEVQFNFFYTSNISLPREVLVEHGGFREDFPAAAWEDIEFAYRAVREGMRLVYQPRARAIHDHRIRPRTFCRRQRTSGLSAAIFAGLHPELEGFLGVPSVDRWRRGHKVLLWALHPLVAVAEHVPGVVPPAVYKRYLDLAYLEGLAEGLQRRGRR